MASISQDVNKEVKDDFALEPVPESKKTLRYGSLVNTTIGVATAMVFMQLGSIMAISFGSVNAIIALVYATVASSLLSVGTCYLAGRSGMNVNLMARGGGFGYIGASLTSIIYAQNFIMYCAIEGAIMAAAVYEYLPIVPIEAYMIFFGLIVIPLNWFGIKQLDKIQKWTLPIYIVLLVAAIYLCFTMAPKYSGNPFTFLPEGQAVGGLGLLACIAIMNGLVAHLALVITDYARFIKKDELKAGSVALGSAIPVLGILVGGVIGIYFGVRFMEGNPGIYFVNMLGIGGALFTILTQLRINVNNLYSGSMSLANFFENVFKFKPGRNFWVATVAIVAIILMLLNVLDYLDVILTFQGVFVFAWVSIILADAFIVKKFMKIGTVHYEYRQSKLYAWNPTGVISIFVASMVGTFAVFGYFGDFIMNIAAFLSGVIAAIMYVVAVKLTNGKFYQKQTVNLENESLTEAQ
ncbi:permease [Siminovitchia acidinfaciens]|uniref:Permease n=1 Tax=Siminovitchia acidinfaciens TaxID=2321395 RepID=A0A429XV45_9BACI|nr:permease [Siminovitchia acidinfaciens]RST72062.1 permease [Siminovitchia acidinfaciens]